MMPQPGYRMDKHRIARSFATAAGTYDAHAVLQRRVADRMLRAIPASGDALRVLDLGSGTGYCGDGLRKQMPNAEIHSLDIAESMLRIATDRYPVSPGGFVCGDAESMPFANGSFDLIVSSLAIQWCVDYPVLFREMRRVLDSGGRMHLSTFGPRTLEELKQAWLQVDDGVHVNRFVSGTSLLRAMHEAGFVKARVDDELILRHYQALDELTGELKGLGARNKIPGQGKGLGGKRKILRLRDLFESSYEPGKGIPVSWEVFYLDAAV